MLKRKSTGVVKRWQTRYFQVRPLPHNLSPRRLTSHLSRLTTPPTSHACLTTYPYFQAGNNMIRFYETNRRKKCLGAIDLMNGVVR
jgi:hypothetical protein